jgi:hypothetical protein
LLTVWVGARAKSAQCCKSTILAADVAEPVAVLVALQLADKFSAAGSQAGHDAIDVLDGERDVTGTRFVRRRVLVLDLV